MVFPFSQLHIPENYFFTMIQSIIMVLFSKTREERDRKRAETFARIRREEAQRRAERAAFPQVERPKKDPVLPFTSKKLVKMLKGTRTIKRKMGTQYGHLKLKVSGVENGCEMELDDDKLVSTQHEGREGEHENKNGMDDEKKNAGEDEQALVNGLFEQAEKAKQELRRAGVHI